MQHDRTPNRTARWLLVALASASLLALGGCSMFGKDKEPEDKLAKVAPEQMYADARKSMRAGNYPTAVQKYEALEARYPFSNQAKQGQLDLLYSYYKNRSTESAIDQADQFIRENPTHPRVDYAYYIRGLTYFDYGAGALERLFHADVSKRPPQESQKALQSFQILLQRYPTSPYAVDARQRLVYLRNRLADFELSVARYYMKRGAYIGAANRARGIIEQYDGAPAVDGALEVMAAAYRNLGLDTLAQQADAVRKANPKGAPVDKDAVPMVAGVSYPAGTEPPEGGAAGFFNIGGSAQRGGRWDVVGGVAMNSSQSLDFEGGTTADISSSPGFTLGAGYNFNDHLRAGGEFIYDSKDYKAHVIGGNPGESFDVKGSLDTMSLMVNGTWNMLSGPLTPYVTGALGYNWVDTNVVNGPPTVACWWDPWWGYVCTGSQNTKTLDGFAYSAGLGVRWDLSPWLLATAGYQMKWVDLGNSKGTPTFDGFSLLFGYKF
jgi:outer membrane protein assembly factor BamD